MQAYQWNAEDYRLHSRAQQAWAQELMQKLPMEGNERVLDLGCGDGKVTVELAAAVENGRVIGVDSSAQMISLAQQHYPQSTYPNMEFAVMDTRAISYRERFDVVFSNAALHWVSDHRPVVEGIARCLRPGGRILLQMGGKGNCRDILPVMDELIVRPQWAGYFHDFEFPYGFLGIEEYQVMLPANGMVAERLELIPKDMVHQDREAFRGWIRTTWLPYTSRVPAAQRDAFIEQLVQGYLEAVPADAQGRVHVDMVRIEVAASKPD